MRNIVRRSVLLFLLLCLPFMAHAEPVVYKLAIVPQYSPIFIYRHWRPVVEELEKSMGVRLEIQTYKNFKQFIKALQAGEADFSYLSPYHLVLARQTQEYTPLLRDAEKQLVGIVVVNKNSPISNVNELEGKTIAFPSPNAFAASLYLRAWLSEKIGIDFTPIYVETHGNVYRNIIRNTVSAGGGVNATLSGQPEALKGLLRVLYEIPGVAAHPIAAHRRVPADVQAAFIKSFEKLGESERGKKLLASIQIALPVKANYARDYAFLEKLNLEKYRGNDK